VSTTGPNTPDQLDIIQQMNKAMQEQNKLLQSIASALGGQAQASQQASQANEKVAETAGNAADKTKELTEALKENTGGSQGLADAMGKQAAASDDANKKLDKFSKGAGKTVAIMGALNAAVAGVGNAIEAANGVFNLFTGGLQAGLGIFKGAIGVIGGFFSGLMGAAADYHNKAAGEMHAANENLRKEFGDITSDQGKMIKGMSKDLGDAQKALGAAGTSLWGTIGRSAAVLQEMTAMAGEMGDSLVRMTGQMKGATGEMLLMRKGMNISGEAFKNMASTAEANGTTMQEALTETMVASAHLSKTFGVDVKVIGKNIDKMAKDVGTFGSMAPKELAAVATYATKLGVSIESLKGTMDAFDTFESAAANAGKLAEAFGMNVDVMGMMNAENPAERMDMLRKSFEETGKSVSDLSRHELKMLSDSMGGMPIDEMKNALSISSDELGFGDFEDAAEEAAQKITPEEAMQDVAKSVDRLATKLDQLAGGPLANFINGFMKIIDRSPEMRELLSLVGKWLKEFHKAGQAVAHLFLDFVRTDGAGAFQMIKDIFNIERIQKFLGVVKVAFGEFFRLVKTDPKAAVENLFDKIFGAFEDWVGSGPTGNNMANLLGGMIENAFLLMAGLVPKIIQTISKYIVIFAEGLRDFLNGDNKTANTIGDGIGGAFMMAFESIKDSVINDLMPALLDLFGVLFEKFGPAVIGILTVVWTAIFVKSIVSAAIAAAAGAALQGGIKFLGDKILGMMSKTGGGGGDEKEAKKAAAITKGIAEGMEDLLEAFRKIKKSDIKKAGEILWEMAKHMIKGMIAMAVGMVAVSAILSVVPFVALIKGIAGLTAAVMNSVAMVGAAILIDKYGDLSKINDTLWELSKIFMKGGIYMAIAGAVMAAAWSMVPVGMLLIGLFAMNALVLTSLPMIGAALLLEKVNDEKKVNSGLLGLAGVMIGAALFAIPAGLFALAWSVVDIGSLLMGIFALNALILGAIPMLVVAFILGNFVDKVLVPVLIGMLGLAGIFFGASLLAIPAAMFTDAWGTMDQKALVGAIFNLNAMVVGMIPFIAVGAALGMLLAGPQGVAVALGMVALGLMMAGMGLATPYIKKGAQALIDDLGGLDEKKFNLATTVLSKMALVAPLLVAAGLVMFVLSGPMVLALVGLHNMSGFISGAASMITDAISALSTIKISDPKKTEMVLDVVTKVIKAVSLLGQLGMQAMSMALSAGIVGFFGAPDPSTMMQTMADFVLDILGKGKTKSGSGTGIIGAVELMVGMAGKFSEKSLKGAEAIAGIVAAIAQLAGALIEPLTKMSENAGGFFGGGKAADMKSMVESVGSGVGSILGAMQTHLIGTKDKPGLIESMLSVFNSPALKKEKPDVLKQRAETLKALFDAILAIVTAVEKLQQFESKGFFGGGKGDAAANIEKMLQSATEVVKSDAMKDMITESIALMNKIKDPAGLKSKAEAMGAVVGGTVEIIKALSDLGNFLSNEEGTQGLMNLQSELDTLKLNDALPSQVIGQIAKETVAIARAMRRMKVNFGKVKLKEMSETVLGYGGDHTIMLAPEGVKLTVNLSVEMNAEDVAVGIAKGTMASWDGFFKREDKVTNYGLDNIGD